MKENLKLSTIFVSHRDELANKLEGFSLPRDTKNVQKVVSDFLNNILDEEGDFRQNLTQAEDYILQAALSLLNAQQDIAKELIAIKFDQNKNLNDSTKVRPNISKDSLSKEQIPFTLGGTLVGGAAGAFLGSWGAMIGAIAGTAVVLYYVSEVRSPSVPQSSLKEKNTQ